MIDESTVRIVADTVTPSCCDFHHLGLVLLMKLLSVEHRKTTRSKRLDWKLHLCDFDED